MKLKENFLTHYVENEQIMIDVKGIFHGIVTSNETAAFIVDCLKEDVTKREIVEKMAEVYDAPEDVIEKDVEKIVSKLESIGALEK
ncbi:MAG: PqqD family protein [Clostridia bacterium]|nr:PqqD family protein [Clostridia bacterium]